MWALVVGVLFGLAGLALLPWGIWQISRERTTTRQAQRTTGVVVDHEQRSTFDGVLLHPIVQYQTANGQPITFVSAVGTSPPLHKVGQRVTVLYDPQQPHEARIRSGVLQYGAAVGIIFAGCFLLLLCCILSIVALTGKA